MWFLLALLSAFFSALSNVARRTHGSLADPAELAWWGSIFALPLTAGLLLVSPGPWVSDLGYIAPATAGAVLSTVAGVLTFKAYKFGEVSAVSPLMNLLPIVLLFTSFVLLGLSPSPMGLVGVLLVVGGVYYSSIHGRHDLLHPFRQITKSKGSRAMLSAMAIFSVVVILERMALEYAQPAFIMVFTTIVHLILLSGYLLLRPMKRRVKRGERVIKRWGWHIAAISTFSVIAVFFQFQALVLVDPTYVMSVKRLDVIITILLAGLFLRERHILKRFKGSVIAVAGVAIIYVLG